MVFTNKTPTVLRVEGVEVCRGSGIGEGIISAFCSYFVFNIQYPKHLKNTLMFLQRYIAKIVLDGDQPLWTTVARQVNILYWPHNAVSLQVSQMLEESIYFDKTYSARRTNSCTRTQFLHVYLKTVRHTLKNLDHSDVMCITSTDKMFFVLKMI